MAALQLAVGCRVGLILTFTAPALYDAEGRLVGAPLGK